MMKERTLRVLEFTRIREMLAEGALTAAGRERCLTLEPFCDLPSVRAAQAETEEAAVILQYTGGHPMTEFPDARPALTVCEITLDIKSEHPVQYCPMIGMYRKYAVLRFYNLVMGGWVRSVSALPVSVILHRLLWIRWFINLV